MTTAKLIRPTLNPTLSQRETECAFRKLPMLSLRLRNVILISTLGILVAGWTVSVQAVEIRDGAGFFSRKALGEANARIAEIEKNYGKEIRIETFKTVPDGKVDVVSRMTKGERAGFFEKWARDRATSEHVRGIYILICRNPGHVQVEEDRQTRNQGFGLADRNALSEKLLAGFRHKDYDQALLDSMEFISRTMKEKLNVRAEADGTGAPAGRADQRDLGRRDRDAGRGDHGAPGMGLVGWLIVGVLIFLGVRLIIALFRGLMGGNRPAGGGYGGGYGPGMGGSGGGGGMMGSLMSGMFGAFAGNWLYNSFFGNSAHGGEPSGLGGGASHPDVSDGAGQDYLGSGGDFDGGGDDAAGGGDFGSGDFGGGDPGGGDFGGGDFGGGDSGGGDF